MRSRRFIALTLLSGMLTSFSVAPCEAGPLLDWLFQRNRANRFATTGASANNAALGSTGWGTAANPNALTTAVGAAPTTAGYGPTSSCGPGFCQQTVLRWVPQVAYRTAYQPVPVTTYKTSTSINPANGLPMTCTRPCTSYTYQARRVPYTSYRPVYTTVPVTDTMGATAAAVSPADTAPTLPGGPGGWNPVQSNYPPSLYGYGYGAGYTPSPTASAGCATCNNSERATEWTPVTAAAQSGYAAGYTPGDTGWMPSDPAAGYASNGYNRSGSYGYGQDSYPQDDARGGLQPTPWEPVDSARQSGRPAYRDAEADRDGATPWRPYSPSAAPDNRFDDTYGRDGTHSRSGAAAADSDPYLDDRSGYGYSSGYGSGNSSRGLKPVPLPDGFGNYGASSRETDSFDRYNERYKLQPEADSNSESTISPNRSDSGPIPLGTRPELQGSSQPSLIGPANQSEQSRRGFDSRGIRDLYREQQPDTAELSDKTVSRSQSKRKPLADRVSSRLAQSDRTNSRSRFAAVPIQWPATKPVARDTNSSSQFQRASMKLQSTPASAAGRGVVDSRWVPISHTGGRSTGNGWVPAH